MDSCNLSQQWRHDDLSSFRPPRHDGEPSVRCMHRNDALGIWLRLSLFTMPQSGAFRSGSPVEFSVVSAELVRSTFKKMVGRRHPSHIHARGTIHHALKAELAGSSFRSEIEHGKVNPGRKS